MKFPQGEGSTVIHRKKNDLLYKDATYMYACATASERVNSLVIGNGSYTGSRSPRVSPHCIYCVVGGVKFPQGEGSAVIHRKKNDLLHKDATYMYVCVTYSLWKGEFTRNRKRVVNRLKIPQGLSTLYLLCRRWSEVPSRGGVRGDSP